MDLSAPQRTVLERDGSPDIESDISVDAHLWGYLQPCNPELNRVDLWKLHRRYSLGSGTHNIIILKGPKISPQHCVISWDGEPSSTAAVLVTDLSTYGTFINGNRIGRNMNRLLKDGNEIAFGTPIPQLGKKSSEDCRFIYCCITSRAPVSGLFAEYDVGEELGKGSFATVYKALRRETGEWFAIKRIIAKQTVFQTGKKDRKRHIYLAREIDIMERLDHPNICRLVKHFWEDDGTVSIVMELISGGNLSKLVLDSTNGVDEPPARDIIFQICTAMAFIHAQGITHRDLKLENILLTRQTHPVVKVADFGLSKVVDEATLLDTMCGTPSYVAPEVFSRNIKGYTNLVDAWSVGVIAFAMVTRDMPFRKLKPNETKMHYVLDRHVVWSILERTSYPLSIEAHSFIRQLLQDDPGSRMSLTDALNDPWLAGYVPYHGEIAKASGSVQETVEPHTTPKPVTLALSPSTRPSIADMAPPTAQDPVPTLCRSLRNKNRAKSAHKGA